MDADEPKLLLSEVDLDMAALQREATEIQADDHAKLDAITNPSPEVLAAAQIDATRVMLDALEQSIGGRLQQLRIEDPDYWWALRVGYAYDSWHICRGVRYRSQGLIDLTSKPTPLFGFYEKHRDYDATPFHVPSEALIADLLESAASTASASGGNYSTTKEKPPQQRQCLLQ